ncbi:MAG: hypothetical protein UT65_C0007G0013 [Parcubacteria group bacterium GW2011_GWF2_39_8b]|nr:MAG: hypothetical protein UT65_C0007G0013 [Parcubacteria group bacterium GW2011_GWF2_39_8b]KKR45855.1 MAG: hypothetical protein UT81_C0005G0013 [Parcubacteria group bacterium GW2011_GWA2_40_14]
MQKGEKFMEPVVEEKKEVLVDAKWCVIITTHFFCLDQQRTMSSFVLLHQML